MIDKIRKAGRTRSDKVTSVAVMILALLMGGQYVAAMAGIQSRAECQAEKRLELGAASDDNQNALILGVARLTAQDQEGQVGQTSPAEEARMAREYRALFTRFTTEAERIMADRQALADGKVCD